MNDSLLRFVLGGTIVSLFAMLADVLRPKSFAGLFGATPSVALATLALTVHREGKTYAAVEGRSMMIGAAAFLSYAAITGCILRRYKTNTLRTTVSLMPVWFGVALLLALLLGVHTS